MPFLLASVFCLSVPSIAGPGDSDGTIPVSPCWNYTARKPITAVTVNEANIYIATEGATVEAVSRDTGERLWTTDLGGEITSNIIADRDQVYLTTRSENSRQRIRSLSAQTGITNWSYDPNQSAQQYILTTGPSVIIVSREAVTSLSASNGGLQWSVTSISGVSSSPVVDRLQLVLPTKTGIKVLSTLDGKLIGEVPVPDEPTAIAIYEDLIYWGDPRGNVYAYDLRDKKSRWQFKAGGRIVGMVSSADGVVLASADNFVYLISRNHGKRKWKSRLSNRIASVSDWDKTYVLILDISGEQVSVLNMKNGRLMSQITPPVGQQFTLLAARSDHRAVIATPVGLISYRLEGCFQNRMAAQ